MDRVKKKIEPKERKSRSKMEKEDFYHKANGKCYYCKKFIPSPNEMILDHKIPISRYGSDEDENIAVACKRCDHIKGTFTEKEFRAHNLGYGRKKPFGHGKGMPPTMRSLRIIMSNMRPESRTKKILTRVLNGERVNITEYPRYVNPRRNGDRLRIKLKTYSNKYAFLKMEGMEIWKSR